MPHSEAHEAMFDRVMRLMDHSIQTREDLHEVKITVKDLEVEIKEVKAELKRKSENSIHSLITTSVKEAMTPQAWALVAFLLLASLMGIISPRQILDRFLGQEQQQSERGSSRGE